LEEKNDFFQIILYLLNIFRKLASISNGIESRDLIKYLYKILYFCIDFSQNITKIYESYIQYTNSILKKDQKSHQTIIHIYQKMNKIVK
jgi:hypothetical protein